MTSMTCTGSVSAFPRTRAWTTAIPTVLQKPSATRSSTWVTLQTAATLPAGSLLLIDGALRVTSQNHEPVLADIIKKAGERDLLLAAVAKRTRATWGGGHPLLPALRGLAGQSGITGPWWTKIDPHLLDNTEYPAGEARGDLRGIAPPARGKADEDRTP